MSATVAPTTVVPTTAPPVAKPPSGTLATSAPTTVAPETTVAPTVPPETAPPTTENPCVSCRPDYVFPYPAFFLVPQLGTEPVRGTGCGANGSIGEVIPDGVWDGHVTVVSGAVTIDLQCVYYGASAAPFIAQCVQTYSEEDCLQNGDQFWIVNNSTRLRTVPLDPSFRRRYASPDGCGDPGPGKGSVPAAGSEVMDSWLVIEHGLATFVLTSCVYG